MRNGIDEDEEQFGETQHSRNYLDPVDSPTSSPPTYEPLVLYKQYRSSTAVIFELGQALLSTPRLHKIKKVS